ncbi:MAG: hypothetical protein ACK4E0_08510 [Chitinophagaceae bacterium]
MRNLKILTLSLLFSFFCVTGLHAQNNFELPSNVVLEAKEDYAKYETAMVDAAKWLEETDLGKEPDKRQEVNAFVLQWVSGSPTVSVEINEHLSKIYGKNIQLIGVYLASYCRHYIENKGTATKASATKAALTSMMNVYKKGIAIKKSKEMDKLIKQAEEGKLDEYVANYF